MGWQQGMIAEIKLSVADPPWGGCLAPNLHGEARHALCLLGAPSLFKDMPSHSSALSRLPHILVQGEGGIKICPSDRGALTAVLSEAKP